MRVVMLNWSDRGHLGGRTLQVADLAAALTKLGHDVRVLDVRRPASVIDQSVADADVLHAHGGVTPVIAQFPRVATWARHRKLRPVVCTLHGWHYRRFADKAERTVERLGLRSCTQITAPNNGMVAQLPHRLRHRARLVPNGVVPVGSTPHVADADVHIMWLGRVCTAKGIETALRSFLSALGQVPNLKLHVVGPVEEPELHGLLSSAAVQANGRVVQWGTVDQPWQKVPADILLHTACYDACPRVILEAMSARVPVATTAVGGIPEMLDHGTNALLAGTSDEPAITGHLVRLATDAALRSRLAAAALERFETNYSIDIMAERILLIYREVLGS